MRIEESIVSGTQPLQTLQTEIYRGEVTSPGSPGLPVRKSELRSLLSHLEML